MLHLCPGKFLLQNILSGFWLCVCSPWGNAQNKTRVFRVPLHRLKARLHPSYQPHPSWSRFIVKLQMGSFSLRTNGWLPLQSPIWRNIQNWVLPPFAHNR